MIKSSYAHFVWTVIILTGWLSLLISLWLAFLLREWRYLTFALFWFTIVVFMAGITSENKPKGITVPDPDIVGKTRFIELD